MNWPALVTTIVLTISMLLYVAALILDARDDRRARARWEHKRAELAAGMPSHRIGQPPRGLQLYGIDGLANWGRFMDEAQQRGYQVTPVCDRYPTPIVGMTAFRNGNWPDQVYIERTTEHDDRPYNVLAADLELIEDCGEQLWERIAEHFPPVQHNHGEDALKYAVSSILGTN